MLPIINHALFKHKLVGADKEVEFRAFTNKEQKILLLVKETKGQPDSQSKTVDAIKQIVQNCTLGKLDVDNLAVFDLEDLFLRIRSKSVSEISNIRYRFDYNDDEGIKKSEFIDVAINLDDVKVEVDPKHTNKIQLTPTMGVIMKYPSFGLIKDFTDKDDVMLACIDKVYNENEVFTLSDYSQAEREAFFDSLDVKSLMAIKEFFNTSPKLKHEIKIKPKNGDELTVTLEGLQDFFT
jgi:hypothetical protein